MMKRDAGPLLFCEARIQTRDAAGAARGRSFAVVASTEAVDSHGTRLRQNWRLARYLANPVVLWAHDSHELPIGLASDVRLEDGRLLATVELAAEGESARADEVWRGVQAGRVRGVSVGFVPHSVRAVKEDDVDLLELDDNELIEISLTPTPSNPEALAQLSRSIRQQGPTMNWKQLLTRALGLSESASDADIAAALEARIGILRELDALTGSAGRESLGRVAAWRQAHGQVTELAAESARLRGEIEQRDRDQIIAGGQAAGKLTGGMLEWARSQPLDVLRSFLEVAPALVPGAGAPPVAPAAPGGVGLTPEDRTVMRLLGQTEEEFVASKRALGAERN